MLEFSFSRFAMAEEAILDRYSLMILSELQRDSRQTVQQLADAVGLSATPCWKRVKEMEAAGIIRGYTALVDREKVGLALCVLAEVNLTRHNEDDVRRFEKEVAACPQIVSCYSTTGQADYMIKVLVPDIKNYERDARALQRRAEGSEGRNAAAAGAAGPQARAEAPRQGALSAWRAHRHAVIKCACRPRRGAGSTAGP